MSRPIEQDEPSQPRCRVSYGGGVAVRDRTCHREATLTLETELPDQDEYEVRIYDERHGRRLVAAIEIISPSNKDRPESRRAFVGKVAALFSATCACHWSTSSRFAISISMLIFWNSSSRRPDAREQSRPHLTPSTVRGRNARAGGHCWIHGSTR